MKVEQIAGILALLLCVSLLFYECLDFSSHQVIPTSRKDKIVICYDKTNMQSMKTITAYEYKMKFSFFRRKSKCIKCGKKFKNEGSQSYCTCNLRLFLSTEVSCMTN